MNDQQRNGNTEHDLRSLEAVERGNDLAYLEEIADEVATPVGRVNRTEDEETAAEIAAPIEFRKVTDRDEDGDVLESGRGYGFTALALSILSLFVLPVLFGAAGIVLGFVARRKGATSLGSWSIGIGAISIVIGIFILPFF